MPNPSRLTALVAAAAFIAAPALAEEITLEHHGLTLNADLALADGKAFADGVILVTHGALAHKKMELIGYLQGLFAERGYSTLAINLGLGLDDRRGMYDCSVTHRHTNGDAADEIKAWVDWLRGQGAAHVTLLGHSRGGAQTALYAAENDDPLVNAVVLMAPATADNNTPEAYQARYGKPLEPDLATARLLVEAGKGERVLDSVAIMGCGDTAATAASFLSYYGQAPSLDTPTLLPRIDEPTLVVVAGDDQVVKGLATKVAPLAGGGRLQMVVIEGAGHFFRDLNADDAVEAIDAFLQGL